MPLLNYTTRIEVAKTIAEIQDCLVSHGAKAIRADYEQGNIVSLSFLISLDGNDVPFKLPSDWKPVLAVLKAQKANPKQRNRGDIQLTEEHARRVAWRVVKDWVEAQMALVEIQMAPIEQIFLPYAVMPNGSSLYEGVKKAGLLLPAPK